MFPRSGGEKVYLEAAYQHPRLLATMVFSTQAILLGFTGVQPLWESLSSGVSECDSIVNGVHLQHLDV